MKETIDIRKDFAIFDKYPDLVYLDSASTTLVPKTTVLAVSDFLNFTTSSTRRGAHRLTVKGSTMVEATRSTLAEYLKTTPSQVSFQKSITTAIASFAYGFDWDKTGRKKLVVAGNEEHSVFVTLQKVSSTLGLDFTTIPIDSNGELDPDGIEKCIDEETGIVAVGHMTVGTGTMNKVRKIANLAHQYGAIVLTDATRSVGLRVKEIESLGADIIVFSSNIGLMGPPGFAIQWVNEKTGAEHTPGILGGSAVTNVSLTSHEVALQPDKFESGVLNVPGIVGLKSSIDYLTKLQTSTIERHIQAIAKYLLEELYSIDGIIIYGSPNDKSSIISINIGEDGINCHDVALFLDDSNIAVRSGLLCAHPLTMAISPDGMIQLSLHIYNTSSDIEKLVSTLKIITEQLI